MVAQLLAMERPDLVEALVVTGAPDVHIKPNTQLLRVFPKLWHVFGLAAPGIGARLIKSRKLMRHLFMAFDPPGGVTEADIGSTVRRWHRLKGQRRRRPSTAQCSFRRLWPSSPAPTPNGISPSGLW
ncbi:hypothetical protein GCM10009712_10660 [Pseudarthrobacter sulfonivorans]